MSEPFLAEIIMFGANFAPRSWALCDGQILPINQNQSLFSLLGTTYGGDGRTSFALPDLRGRMPMGEGHGAGLSNRPLGQKSGAEENFLNATHVPSHTHTATNTVTGARVAVGSDDNSNPTDRSPGTSVGNLFTNADTVNMGTSTATATPTIGSVGGQGLNNMQPWLAINFIIALQGLFPSRN